MITEIGSIRETKETAALLIELDNLVISTLFAISLNRGNNAVTKETAIAEWGRIKVKKAFW
jgi:hypothetical protein